jgi:hypothetical protein
MKNLVTTLDINYPKEITDLTFPYMEEYAKNIDADFKIITERKFSELPIPMEKFQLYEICKDYEWTIFLDADCLVNPKTINFTKVVECDIVIVSEYLDILNSKDPQFETKNVMGKYDLDIDAPFSFLSFHNSQKNVVKPWGDPLQYKKYINVTEGMKKYNINQEWHLDDFLLATNIVKYGISTVSVKNDFPHTTIAHNGNYLNLREKVNSIKQNIERLKNLSNIQGEYI